MGTSDKKSLEAVLAEFRRGIAHHRAQGATEDRIRQILGEAIYLAFQQVKDREQRAWSSAKLHEWRRLSRTTRQARRCIDEPFAEQAAQYLVSVVLSPRHVPAPFAIYNQKL